MKTKNDAQQQVVIFLDTETMTSEEWESTMEERDEDELDAEDEEDDSGSIYVEIAEMLSMLGTLRFCFFMWDQMEEKYGQTEEPG